MRGSIRCCSCPRCDRSPGVPLASPRLPAARRVTSRRARGWRAVLAVLLGAALFPGLYLPARNPALDARDYSLRLVAVPLPLPGGSGHPPVSAAPQLEAAWQLRSPNSDFGSFSALAPFGPGRLISFSDRGGWMELAIGRDRPELTGIGTVPNGADGEKQSNDIESAAFDAVTGTLWLGYEMRNELVRMGPRMAVTGSARPRAMRHWAGNSGAEAMTRLGDGRFLVLSEGSQSYFGRALPGLLFAGDPVERPPVTPFRLVPPAGYSPTDMAPLPDGRVLILLRSWHVRRDPDRPLRFTARLVLADPATIRPGQDWPWQPVATWEDETIPLDNYEGLAVIPQADGRVTIWLMSDDNGLKMQRTLLLRFSWIPLPR
jgi:hypothetical protein